MPFSSTGKNLMLDVAGGNEPTNPSQIYGSLHTADPGDTGTSEVTGGSPAYARKALNFSAATGGTIDSSNAPAFDVPASTTVAYVGIWDAVTGGNFLGSADVTDEAFGAQGTYTLNDFDMDLNS